MMNFPIFLSVVLVVRNQDDSLRSMVLPDLPWKRPYTGIGANLSPSFSYVTESIGLTVGDQTVDPLR
jgi:hypothetical protein